MQKFVAFDEYGQSRKQTVCIRADAYSKYLLSSGAVRHRKCGIRQEGGFTSTLVADMLGLGYTRVRLLQAIRDQSLEKNTRLH